MLTLNLVYKDKSDIPYEVITFSDSQVYFRLTQPEDLNNEDILIKSRFSWNDLQIIIAARAALKETYVDRVLLYIPYFLGGRSDRKFVVGGNNYIKDVIAPIINSMELGDVTVLDPHSDVIEGCINNIQKKDNLELVEWALDDLYPIESDPDFVIVSPDAGALKKIYNVAEQIGYEDEIIVASKHRDIRTGKILSTEVPLPSSVVVQSSPPDFIIIDDICDGGRTFIEIAKVIREKLPSANIYLIVTHGIFSAGLNELSQYFTKIYTTNSVQDFKEFEPDGFVKQLNVF